MTPARRGPQAVNDLLLVIIFLELFGPVVRFLQTEILSLEPYLAVGIIACTRRVLPPARNSPTSPK